MARRQFIPIHDRGRVLIDTAVMLADGGESISDIGVLRHQSGLMLCRARPEPLLLLLVLGTAAVCYFLPELLLSSRSQERNDEIQLELADTLDQMTIAVEAGLGFDAAMARAGRNGTGPLAQELIRTLQEIQVGQLRRAAYESLALRTDVPDLRRFVRAIIQADAYGISVADVLRTQAAEMLSQAPPARGGESPAGARQGDLPAPDVHPARTVHRAARPHRDQHDGGVLLTCSS